jgi:hypothetical protein
VVIAGGALAAIWFLSQQGVSDTPGVADPDETNSDGSAVGGTDAGIFDQVVAAVTGIPDYINAWADAITGHEGWAPGSRSFRNNNPGNLRVTGDQGVDSGGFGVFSTYALGRAALTGDLGGKVRKYGAWTVYQVMARYAPPSDGNDTVGYAAAVAGALGCASTSLVSTIGPLWASTARVWLPATFAGQPAQVLQVVADPTQIATSLDTPFIGDPSEATLSDPSSADDGSEVDA